jgi:hypothetical protein
MVFSQLAGDSESLAKGLPVERFQGKPSSVLSMTGAKKFANAPRKQQGGAKSLTLKMEDLSGDRWFYSVLTN